MLAPDLLRSLGFPGPSDGEPLGQAPDRRALDIDIDP